MSSVGYGDISPINNNEKLLIIFISFFSCVLFGYIITSISTIINEISIKNNVVLENLTNINRYMSKMLVNKST